MVEAIISVVIGLPIALIYGFLFFLPIFCPEIQSGFGPLVFGPIYLLLFFMGGPVIFSLLVLGLILGIQGVKQKRGKWISCIGIGLNVISLMIGIYIIADNYIYHYRMENLKGVVLKENKEEYSIVFPKGTTVDFYESGEIKRAILHEETKFNGMVLPEGTVVFLAGGSFPSISMELDSGLEIDGLKCTSMEFSEYYDVVALSSVCLSEDQNVNGILLPAQTEVHFYKSGNFDRLKLPVESDFMGVKGIKQIHFYEDGETIRSFRSCETQEIQGILLAKNMEVYFYKSGILESGALADDQEIQGISLARDSRVSLYESGTLEEGMLSDDQEIQGISLARDSRVGLYESGILKKGILSDDQKIQGTVFLKGTWIEFSEFGQINRLLLVENQKIKGKEYKKGQYLKFDSSGNFIR